MSHAKLKNKAHGFTLIEILVALLVFWLGLLGVALYTASGLKLSAFNQVRATAIKAASQSAEPMTYHTRHDCLSTFLATYPRTVSVDNGKDTYKVSLLNAVDGSGTEIATGTATATTIAVASSGWVSPVTVTLQVPYQGANGTVIVSPTYTMILQNYSVTCDA